MIKKIIRVIRRNTGLIKKNNELLNELNWANVYYDSIRGKDWLLKTPLNIGRWAGNYTFFYVLNRIMTDYKPKKVLELGLGESTKFISKFMDNYLLDSLHVIVEHDNNWKDIFSQNFNLSERSTINIHPLINKTVQDFQVKSYQNFEEYCEDKYDFYIIDGPFGSENYSRYEIVNIANKLDKGDEFIIVFDDFDRKGERETGNYLMELLKEKKINIYSKVYSGQKSVLVIGSEKYKYITSL